VRKRRARAPSRWKWFRRKESRPARPAVVSCQLLVVSASQAAEMGDFVAVVSSEL